MIFLADILVEGSLCHKVDKIEKKVSSTTKKKKKTRHKKANKPKKSVFTKLVNKTAGVVSFTEGEMAVVKSLARNDVKTPLKGNNEKQKTIGAKKNSKYHRSV